MDEKAPLRTMDRASLDSLQDQNFFFCSSSRNGNEHGRERQQSEKAGSDTQSREIEENIKGIISETRNQSAEDNDDEREQARRCYRKKKG